MWHKVSVWCSLAQPIQPNMDPFSAHGAHSYVTILPPAPPTTTVSAKEKAIWSDPKVSEMFKFTKTDVGFKSVFLFYIIAYTFFWPPYIHQFDRCDDLPLKHEGLLRGRG